MTWRPESRSKQVCHVHGEYKPFNPPPHAVCGIDKGEYDALFFMRNLRGRLVQAESSDDKVWVASSIDPKTQSLVTIVFNDAWADRDINLSIGAPSGASFDGGTVGRLTWKDEDGTTDGTAEETVKASGNTYAFKETLKPSRAVCVSLKLKGKLPDTPEVTRTQIFAGDKARDNAGILFTIKPGATQDLPIALPGDAASAKRAWLRVVLERVGLHDGWAQVGGQKTDLPPAYTPCNSSCVKMIEIDPKTLKGVKSLTFGATPADQGGNGYLLCAASIILEK
jgi:hypothetical protein